MGKQFNTEKHKILTSTKTKRLCYSKGYFWIEDSKQEKKSVLVSTQKITKYRLFERALRLVPRTGFTLYEEFYFSLRGFLYHVDEVKKEAEPVFQFRKGMNNPLMICKCQWTHKEIVYWGEYWPNPDRDQVSIFAFDGNKVKKVCILSGIKHIHSIVWDKYRCCFWITTGDTDDESRIYRASRTFDNLEVVFMGKQKYRTCALIPMEKGLLYATDSPLCSNSLLFSESEKDCFLEPVEVSPLPGPCIFCQEYHHKYYFSTSVEPNPNQNIISYWMSCKASPGNVDRKSYVLCVDNNLKTQNVFMAKKDIHNMAFFQFGSIQLLNDVYTDSLVGYCVALSKYDGKSVKLMQN